MLASNKSELTYFYRKTSPTKRVREDPVHSGSPRRTRSHNKRPLVVTEASEAEGEEEQEVGDNYVDVKVEDEEEDVAKDGDVEEGSDDQREEVEEEMPQQVVMATKTRYVSSLSCYYL